jgi:apolipoprotein N-acyltransferase
MIAALVALASGVVLAAALPPSGMWPLALALAVPFALIATPSAGRGVQVWRGFALGFFGLYVLWLPLSFSSPGCSGPSSGSSTRMLIVLAAMWGSSAGLARLVAGRGAATLWLLPPLWVLVEWARSQGYFAFPWGTLGYVWLETPVAQARRSWA